MQRCKDAQALVKLRERVASLVEQSQRRKDLGELVKLRARVSELEAKLASAAAAAHVRADQFVRARVAASYWHPSAHADMCYSQWPGDNKPNGGKCNCGSDDNNAARDELRRALKLGPAE